MGHTPGPWTANGGDIMCDANYCVAVAYRARTDDDGNWMPHSEVDANANLIAAAPELLTQLRMAAEFISGHNECLSEPSGSGDRQWNDYCIGLLDGCMAAIAKAEGRGE